jgi:hypothetical protein
MNGLNEFARALSKSMHTTADLAEGMGVTYDDDIQMKTFQYSPLLQVLEGKGRTDDVDTADVTFFRETPTNTAQFIAEGTALPAHGNTTYTPITQRMKELVSSISVSELAQTGTKVTNLIEREVKRGFYNVNSKQDYTLLNGTGTNNSYDYPSIIKDIPNGNKSNVNGVITEDAIDDMLTTIIDDNDGHPDILVTDNFVAKQLKAIAAPYRRFNDKVDIGLGFRVATYESPDGAEIPVLVDKNMPVTSSAHRIAFIDSSAIEIAYLHRPGVKELSSQTLSSEFCVRAHTTACNVAPFRCGLIEGIKAPSS